MGRYFGSSFDERDRIGQTAGHWTFPVKFPFFDDLNEAPSDATAIVIGRHVANSEDLSRFTDLQQVNLVNPTNEQVELVFQQKQLKRLLFGDAHRFRLDGIQSLQNLEELAFLNSSGPKELGVLGGLPKLRSLMLENLRGLSDWSSVGEARNLRCFCLTGGFVEAVSHISTLDYLRQFSELEHVYIAGLSYKGDYPAFEGLRQCKQLKTAAIVPGCFSLEDNAYLEAHIPSSARYFKRTYEVNGKGNATAATLQDAEELEAHEAYGVPEGRLSWIPLVQFQKGRPFTRIYTGPREKVLDRLKEFEACYADALKAAQEA